MVCAAEEEEASNAVCVLSDMRSGNTDECTGNVTLFQPPTTTVGQFLENAAKQFKCPEDSFDLVLVKNIEGVSVTLKNNREETLKDVGVVFSASVTNNFVLSNPKSSHTRLRRRIGGEDCASADVAMSATKDEVLGSGEHPRPSTIGNFPSSKAQWGKAGKGDFLTDYPLYLPPGGPPIPAPPPAPPPLVSQADSSSYTISAMKPDTRYVGLVNQAMTCYLNSLLQALYMTPEFRNALYEWSYDGTEEGTTNSIPFHLQKLFLNLQTSSRPAVETTELTKSFGWESSTAWQQHDVQELCRVMFDALEQKFKNTPHSDLIQRLYEGNMIDSVKCRECSTEKCRKDTFLDIPLAVRPFGFDVSYGSVEEALRAFVQPETLDGNNQYHCESCNKKCDAYKMLKFSKFPYILTLHLKRFDFDCNTLHRIKLNDKVVFPKILDLNSFVEDACKRDESTEGPAEGKGTNDMRCDDGASSTTDSGSALDEDHNGFPVSAMSPGGGEKVTTTTPPPPSSTGTGDVTIESQEDDEGIDVSSMPSRTTKSHNHINHGQQNNIDDEDDEDYEENDMKERRGEQDSQMDHQASISTGPFVYELFSIMIHSGSATGGHYYAYIKDFATGEWLCFNDQSVTRITEEDIKKTYGGGLSRGYYSGAYSSSTNAYMLMYRQIDKSRNCLAMAVDQFPLHIKELLAKLTEKEELERAARERDLDSIKMKVFLNHPVQNTLVDARLFIPKTSTLKEAVSVAYQVLELEGVVDLNQCRLVSYDQVLGSIECSFEGREHEPIGDILAPYAKYDLLLETKDWDSQFEVYHPGGVVSRVYLVDINTEVIRSPVTLRKNMSMTVAEFKECLYKDLDICSGAAEVAEEGAMRPPLFIVMEKHNMELRLLDDETRTLKKEDFGTYHRIFVSLKLDDEPSKQFIASKLYRIVKDFVHIITLKVTLPDVDKEILERMSIPPLSESRAEGVSGSDEGGFEDNYNMRPIIHRPKASNMDEEDEDEGIGDGECVGCSVGDAGNWTGRMCVPNENEVSGRNSDQSASEDSSLTDSERTLVGEHQEEALAQVSSSSNSPQGSDHERGISSPEEGAPSSRVAASKKVLRYKDLDGEEGFNLKEYWDNDLDLMTAGSKGETSHPNAKFYFKATEQTEGGSNHKSMKVQVDKRMVLSAFKQELEPYVGVSVDYFKLFRIMGHQEYEFNRPGGPLTLFQDGDQILIRLGRVLRIGECLSKVYLLAPNEIEYAKFVCEFVLMKGQTVLSAKRGILAELKKRLHLDVAMNRCHLRKKCWKGPGEVYVDNQRFDDDIPLLPNWEMFIQVLSPVHNNEKGEVGDEGGAAALVKEEMHYEHKTSLEQVCLFTRRWHPDKLEISDLQEVVLNGSTINELKEKLSRLSGIPVDRLELAPAQGQFPYVMPILSVHSDLEWDTQKVPGLADEPFKIYSDGSCIFYRDSSAQLRKPSPEERPTFFPRSNKGMLGSPSSYSPRKEKSLKIYLDSTPSTTQPQCKEDSEVD